ncbi:MAG: hypothetical protein JXR05_14545 [Flavobacteriaceae bacterium]
MCKSLDVYKKRTELVLSEKLLNSISGGVTLSEEKCLDGTVGCPVDHDGVWEDCIT